MSETEKIVTLKWLENLVKSEDTSPVTDRLLAICDVLLDVIKDQSNTIEKLNVKIQDLENGKEVYFHE